MTERHIGEAFRKARIMRGMTQEQLAELAGVHENSICNLENSGSSHVRTCIAVAAVLDFDFSRIVREAENMCPATKVCGKELTAPKMVQ
jgi:DNA-binding XRE family transcriptional regulator